MMFPEALKAIEELYATDTGGVGGYAHIVTDDGNCEDGNIEHCLKDAEAKVYAEELSEETRLASIKCLKELQMLTVQQREDVIDFFHTQHP